MGAADAGPCPLVRRTIRHGSRCVLDLLPEWADDDATRKKILVDNPAKLYGF
jgi:D-galactarolactone isomerase